LKKLNNGLSIVTIINIALISILVCAVGAAMLGAFWSPKYTYTKQVNGYIQRSADGLTWDTSDSSGLGADHWYCMFVTEAGFSGTVTMSWTLFYNNGTVVDSVLPTTTITTLTGAAEQEIFCTADGNGEPGRDWVLSLPTSEAYKIQVVFTGGP